MGVYIKAISGNFQKLQEIILLYEATLGARMNLAKTVIISLGFNIVPQWVHATGYKISASGEIQQYLGAPIGNQLNQADMHGFYLEKIGKIISGWSNRLLSFSGKVILI